jgi:hypothetical protein
VEPRPNHDDVVSGGLREEELESVGFLSWAEMRAMVESGHIEIQSHAKTHTWYFDGPEIVDFHRPEGTGGYRTPPWMSWNMAPELKYGYLGRDLSRDIPFGAPIYRHERALVARRFFEDPGLTDRLVKFVEEKGGESFFARDDWRSILEGVVRDEGQVGGRFETEEEYTGRVRRELELSRKAIADNLGTSADFLCWPGGGHNETTLRLAAETGYMATTTHFQDPAMRNVPGDTPDRINRIGSGSPWTWKEGTVVKRTPVGLFIATLERFAGKKLSIWKLRWFKLLSIIRYYVLGIR